MDALAVVFLSFMDPSSGSRMLVRLHCIREVGGSQASKQAAMFRLTMAATRFVRITYCSPSSSNPNSEGSEGSDPRDATRTRGRLLQFPAKN